MNIEDQSNGMLSNETNVNSTISQPVINGNNQNSQNQSQNTPQPNELPKKITLKLDYRQLRRIEEEKRKESIITENENENDIETPIHTNVQPTTLSAAPSIPKYDQNFYTPKYNNDYIDEDDEDDVNDDEESEYSDHESFEVDDEDIDYSAEDEDVYITDNDPEDDFVLKEFVRKNKKKKNPYESSFKIVLGDQKSSTKKSYKKRKRDVYDDIYINDTSENNTLNENFYGNIYENDLNDDENLAQKLSKQRFSLRSKKTVNYAELDSIPDIDEILDEEVQEEITPVQNDQMDIIKLGPRTEEDELLDKVSQIEKILAYRIEKKKPTENGTPSKDENSSPMKKSNYDDVNYGRYEYLVKYKMKSYLKCEWLSEDVIGKARLGKQRLQRFHNKSPELDPDPPFDPEYAEVDRILARSFYNDKLYYLVKWQGLPYNECTWEEAVDVNDPEKIAVYEQYNTLPSPEQIEYYNVPVQRPHPSYFQKLEDFQFINENKLRNYQIEGVNWLRYCWYTRRNSILADEMGLGKTIQSVSIIWYLFKYQNIRGPFLVIAPLSTIPHWRREFEAWTNLNCIVYHGNTVARDIIRQYEWNYFDQNGNVVYPNIYKFNVIVTTYEMILTDAEIFSQINWKYVIIDEAHRLKNKSSRVLNEFMNFKYDHLLLLTGTPIQNNTQELWTLLNLLDRYNFPDVDLFLRDFGNLKDASQVNRLHEILKPYLLRRMKEDVEKSLAPKEETIIEVELTTIQKKYYKAILERNFDHLVGGRSRAVLPSLLNVMMQLRKCCNHPFLLKGVEDAELEILSNKSKDSFETLIEASGKLVLIDKLLPRLKEEGHKVLIFSQMVRVLDILEDYMNYRGYKHERLDGSIRGPERQASIDRFTRNKDIFVFLLCTRAGGVGINLTAADTVIIFDSDWNPQNDLQAQARCHRIGQDKAVKVYRLLTRNTYERNMFERASLKLGLDQAVLNRSHDDDSGESKPKFTTQEVDSLLKYGVYDLFREDDSVSEKFREENIEDIFARRTTKVIHEPGKAGSTFSKASFVSDESNKDLDIDDPDFWKKVMPDVADKPDPNIIYMPRQRRQLLRDGQYDVKSDDSPYDDTYLDEEGRSKRKSFIKNSWSLSQRNRFIKVLTQLGFGRWKDIKSFSRLNKSLKDISIFGKAYLKHAIEAAKIKDGEINEIMERLTNAKDRVEDFGEEKVIQDEEYEEEVEWIYRHDPMLNDVKFLDSLKTSAPQTIKRFELLVEIGDLVRTNFEEFKTFPSIDGGRFFDSWWGIREDKDLLIGTYKWGFGQYDKMIKDPELSYYGYSKPKDYRRKSNQRRSKKSYEEEDDDDDIEEDEEDEEENDEPKEEGEEKEELKEETKAETSSESQPKEIREMPQYKLLTHRVKHLLKAFANMRKRKLNEKNKKKVEKKNFRPPRTKRRKGRR